ncbi:hypothetical protein NIES4102_30520 [Chondrocystis sp. NIES-4102]|nr:hypothetical protein NIES4102_30520 [Chondrocystis sp. NIES-4102]
MPSLTLGKITNYLSAIAPFICLAGIVVLQSQEYKKSTQELETANYLRQEQAQARKIRYQGQTPTLNFDNLIANWTYLNFVQYFGDEPARQTIGYELVPNYFETISKLDPNFTEASLRLAIANSMYAGYPEQTVTMMEQLLELVDPKSEQSAALWTSKGLDELLFLGDKKAATNSYEMADKWRKVSNNSNVAESEIDITKISELELKEAQIRAWSGVLVHVKDMKRKTEIMEKINILKLEISALQERAQD